MYEAPVIRALDPDVIKQIAAGEVINQPINAVKELLENSIDAGSTSIVIRIVNGGYTSIRIEDDGCGIRYNDLPQACKRYTTSKIRHYSDLTNVSTFGFRGEALASMSACSHLSIISKTENETKGYYAQYSNGELDGPIEPTSATNGTIIEIRDLFFNNPIRLENRPKSNTQAKKISDMISKYSVVYPHIAFTFFSNDKELYKSFGESTFDVVLRQIYTCEDPDAFFQLNFDIDQKTSVEMFLSSPGNSKAPKSSAIFINGRLVTNDRIKHGIENVYIDVLPRGSHPFFFCVITLPSENVEVNVHPSKKEVKILDETDIVYKICLNVKEALQERANQRGVEFLQNKINKKSHKIKIPENQTVFSFPDGQMQLLSQKDQPTTIDNKLNSLQVEEQYTEANQQGKETKNENYFDENSQNNEPNEIQNNIDSNEGEHLTHQNETNSETAIEPRNSQNMKKELQEGNNTVLITTVEHVPLSFENFQEKKPQFLSDSDNSEDTSTDLVNKRLLSIVNDLPPKPKKKTVKDNIGIFDDLKYDPLLNKKPIDRNLQTLEQVLTQPQVAVPKPFRVVNLESVKDLRKKVEESFDKDIDPIIKNGDFVGFIGLKCALVQYQSKLYLINLYSLIKDFLYQWMLKYFANFNQQRFNPPISIEKCIQVISNEYSSYDFSSSAPMLTDYFSISIMDNLLYSLPQTICGYTPSYTTLPLFFKQLASKVNWEEEEECYIGVLDALSSLYSVNPEDEENAHLTKRLQNEIMTTIFPALKTEEYKPSGNLRDCISICQVNI